MGDILLLFIIGSLTGLTGLFINVVIFISYYMNMNFPVPHWNVLTLALSDHPVSSDPLFSRPTSKSIFEYSLMGWLTLGMCALGLGCLSFVLYICSLFGC